MNTQFADLCLLLRTDQGEQALAQLAEAPELQPAQRLYLDAWQAARQEQWDVLSRILLSPDGIADGRTLLAMSIRRRRAWLCWLLGNLARQVGQHEDALGWYTRCIQFLDERRMNDPRLRIQALCGRGAALLRTGAIPASLGEFERAFEIAQKVGPQLVDIYAGLCEVHTALGHAERSIMWGIQGLDLATGDAQHTTEIRLLLGRNYLRLGACKEAEKAWELAVEEARCAGLHALVVQGLMRLADLVAGQGNVSDAHVLCGQAMLHVEQVSPALRGSFYLLCGKLARKPAETARWYEQALVSLADCPAELSLAYVELARLAESAGQMEQATAYWKAAMGERS